MKKLLKYTFIDIIKSRIMLLYTIALLCISFSVFNISDTSEKAIISLLNIEMIVVPLICSVFSTIYYYNSSEFIELLVAQPLKRVTIFVAIVTSLIAALSLAFVIGVGFPLLFYSASAGNFVFVISGLALTACFTAFSMLAAVYTRDKAKGLGIAVLFWFYFTLIYDGIVLFLLFQFSDYPLENFMIVLSCLNPLDLVRILVLLEIDIAAIMGYTGAIFREFFGSGGGMFFSAMIMALWIFIPSLFAIRKFRSKDL